MLRQARQEAGMSREAAAFALHIGTRTLASYERGETVAPSDVVLRMAEVYGCPDLPANHCSIVCPIGQKFAHRCQRNDLATTALGIINELSDINDVKRDLISIAADGQVCGEEMPRYKAVIAELIDLEKAIAEAKQVAARKGVDIASLIGNEKSALAEAL